jgi:hypothetical protein
MAKVIFDISMSLDGFVTCSNGSTSGPSASSSQRREPRRGTHRGPAHLRSFRSVVEGGWSGGPCSGSGIRRHPCRAWGSARGRRVHFCERWDRERPRAVEGGRRG